MPVSPLLNDLSRVDEMVIAPESVCALKTITESERYFVFYTLTECADVPAEILWMLNGYFDTYEQGVGSIMLLMGVTGVRIVKITLPVYYLPQVLDGKPL